MGRSNSVENSPSATPADPSTAGLCLRRRAFTLFEVLVAMSVAAVTGAAALLAVASALSDAHTGLERSVASGLARQLMDEIAAQYYADPELGDPQQTVLGPETGEVTGYRTAFDDIDDYHGWQASPPERKDASGLDRLGSPAPAMESFSRSVVVQYVADADPDVVLASGQTSFTRRVTVSVAYSASGKTRTAAQLQRIFRHVPPE